MGCAAGRMDDDVDVSAVVPVGMLDTMTTDQTDHVRAVVAEVKDALRHEDYERMLDLYTALQARQLRELGSAHHHQRRSDRDHISEHFKYSITRYSTVVLYCTRTLAN